MSRTCGWVGAGRFSVIRLSLFVLPVKRSVLRTAVAVWRPAVALPCRNGQARAKSRARSGGRTGGRTAGRSGGSVGRSAGQPVSRSRSETLIGTWAQSVPGWPCAAPRIAEVEAAFVPAADAALMAGALRTHASKSAPIGRCEPQRTFPQRRHSLPLHSALSPHDGGVRASVCSPESVLCAVRNISLRFGVTRHPHIVEGPRGGGPIWPSSTGSGLCGSLHPTCAGSPRYCQDPSF